MPSLSSGQKTTLHTKRDQHTHKVHTLPAHKVEKEKKRRESFCFFPLLWNETLHNEEGKKMTTTKLVKDKFYLGQTKNRNKNGLQHYWAKIPNRFIYKKKNAFVVADFRSISLCNFVFQNYYQSHCYSPLI